LKKIFDKKILKKIQKKFRKQISETKMFGKKSFREKILPKNFLPTLVEVGRE